MRKLISMITAMVMLVVPCASLAEEPEVVVVTVAQEETEPAKPVPYDEPTEHDLSYSDVEALARLAWCSPLRQATQKRALMWSVLNRIGVPVYGNTLSEVVNTTEYPWYDKDAHISTENERLAREVLNAWLSEMDGLWINRLVPRSGVMVRFVNESRAVQILDRNGNCVWEAE